LRAADITGPCSYTIRTVAEASMPDGESKLVAYFTEIEQGLVLNVTNERRLAEDLGDETGDWRGRRVTLDTIEVDFRGDLVRSIRVRGDGSAPQPGSDGAIYSKAQRAARTAKLAQEFKPDDLDDEIPF
jgi:hypothetical protein